MSSLRLQLFSAFFDFESVRTIDFVLGLRRGDEADLRAMETSRCGFVHGQHGFQVAMFGFEPVDPVWRLVIGYANAMAHEWLRDLTAIMSGLMPSAGARLARTKQPATTEPVSIVWFKDPPLTITVAEALTQGAMHSHYHRGQNATRLRELGGEPPPTDLIVWYWKGRRAPLW